MNILHGREFIEEGTSNIYSGFDASLLMNFMINIQDSV